MSLIAMRRSLLVIAGMLLVILIGGWIWLGKAAMSEVFFPGLMAVFLFFLLAEIIGRVEVRISELEDKLKGSQF